MPTPSRCTTIDGQRVTDSVGSNWSKCSVRLRGVDPQHPATSVAHKIWGLWVCIWSEHDTPDSLHPAQLLVERSLHRNVRVHTAPTRTPAMLLSYTPRRIPHGLVDLTMTSSTLMTWSAQFSDIFWVKNSQVALPPRKSYLLDHLANEQVFTKKQTFLRAACNTDAV